MADLGAEDLWHIGNTRRPQFTAHYLPRPTPRSRIFRRRLLLTSRFSSLFLLTGVVSRRLRDFLSSSPLFYFFPPLTPSDFNARFSLSIYFSSDFLDSFFALLFSFGAVLFIFLLIPYF